MPVSFELKWIFPFEIKQQCAIRITSSTRVKLRCKLDIREISGETELRNQ